MKHTMSGLFVLCAALVAAGCFPSGIDSIQRENLFSLDIGLMEDQIALYGLEGGDGRVRHIELAMRDGFFYIADNNGGKIVRYNSYGDLLFMVYNDETNPDPISLKIKAGDGSQVTRWAFTYPFRSPGRIAVDSRKHIYVEERLPHERHHFDSENKALLDSVILHFDADGRFVEYLGQGGQGGAPFPHIVSLCSSVQDELAVICRLPLGWNVYWYSSQGEQLFQVQLMNSAVPVPPHWSGFIASIDAIFAAPDERKLYIKVDYYREVSDESTNTRTSIEPANSLLWILDVEKGIYENSLEVPLYEHSISEKGRSAAARLPYSMMGLVRGGGILFYFPAETGYAVLRMNANGHGQRRSFIQVDPDEMQFNDFHLSPEGILSALLVDDWKINVVWWRLDRFMRDLL
ncbi:MAG: hypothetical protein LBI06_08215 [Treponema sp.]|jgi:hypothetical protein|nr:hypothetical protein [Treponema sp.]